MYELACLLDVHLRLRIASLQSCPPDVKDGSPGVALHRWLKFASSERPKSIVFPKLDLSEEFDRALGDHDSAR